MCRTGSMYLGPTPPKGPSGVASLLSRAPRGRDPRNASIPLQHIPPPLRRPRLLPCSAVPSPQSAHGRLPATHTARRPRLLFCPFRLHPPAASARSFRHGRGRGRGLELGRGGGRRCGHGRPQGPENDRAQVSAPSLSYSPPDSLLDFRCVVSSFEGSGGAAGLQASKRESWWFLFDQFLARGGFWQVLRRDCFFSPCCFA